ELFEAGTFFREPDPLRLETTSLLGEGVVPGEDRIRFGCRRGLLDDGPLLFDRCGGRRRPGLDPGLGHEVGLHRLTQFPDARRLDAITGLPDGHPPWDGPHRLDASPGLVHVVDPAIGEVDRLVGDEGDLLTVEDQLEGGGHQTARADVVERPSSQRLPLEEDLYLVVLYQERRRDTRVVQFGDSYLAGEPHRLTLG